MARIIILFLEFQFENVVIKSNGMLWLKNKFIDNSEIKNVVVEKINYFIFDIKNEI